MTAVAFDTLKFSKRLIEAGFTDKQAATLAEEQAALMDDKIATKRDMKELETALKRDLMDVETRLKTEIEDVRRDIRESEQRVIIKLGSMMVVAVGVVAALVKLL